MGQDEASLVTAASRLITTVAFHVSFVVGSSSVDHLLNGGPVV